MTNFERALAADARRHALREELERRLEKYAYDPRPSAEGALARYSSSSPLEPSSCCRRTVPFGMVFYPMPRGWKPGP